MTIERVTPVGRELATAFKDLVEAVPGRPQRPQALAQALGLDKSISHRLIAAISKGDPVATAHVIPGPEPLRRVVRAARQRGVGASLAERAERAVEEFERLIREAGGDRTGLDALISTWLPSARQRFESAAKQTLYRGARQLKGLSADVSIGSHLIHPSPDARRHDGANIVGYLGLRRIRPEASLKVGVTCAAVNAPGARFLTLTRRPIEHPRELLAERFCSQPAPALIVHYKPATDEWVYEVDWGNAVGPDSARNVITCNLLADAWRRWCQPGDERPRVAVSEPVAVPTRTFIFDLLLHADVCPGREPWLRTVESGARGPTDPNDPTGDLDVLPIAERVEFLGWGVERFRAEEIPDYVELLTDVCRTLGWDPQRFRGYRARIDYPVFQSWLQYVIDLPVALGESTPPHITTPPKPEP